MGAHVKQLQVEIEVLGKRRLVTWEEHGGGTFVIEGVKSYAEMVQILGAVGDVVELPAIDPELEQARAEVRSAVAVDEVPAAPPVTQPLTFKNAAPRFDLPATAEVNPGPKATGATGATAPSRPSADSGSGTTRSAGAASASTPTPSAETTTAGTASEDLGVFANMNSFQQVVAEIRRRGHVTYAAILAFASNLQGIGDVCPPLDNLVDPRDAGKTKARLEDRLKTHLTKLGISTD